MQLDDGGMAIFGCLFVQQREVGYTTHCSCDPTAQARANCACCCDCGSLHHLHRRHCILHEIKCIGTHRTVRARLLPVQRQRRPTQHPCHRSELLALDDQGGAGHPAPHHHSLTPPGPVFSQPRPAVRPLLVRHPPVRVQPSKECLNLWLFSVGRRTLSCVSRVSS